MTMTLRLHDTATGKKRDFEPLDPANVRMYVCGLTVYGHAHIGNARPPVVFDILYRLLRHLYGADCVTYASNVTDIDDKIMTKAAEEGVAVPDLAERYTRAYLDDMAALGVIRPDLVPRATETLDAMIAMIGRLIDAGCAYEAEGHVLFNVPAMADYGKLSRRDRDEMIAGARVDVAPYKKDPADFVLWKPSADDQPGWDSPWGRGRPGWHLECSAMIERHLGETIDIHGGGLDLVFPHHENEIAQSECAHGGAPFVRYWVHNGMLNLKGEKMAKSVGNVEAVRDLLADFPGEAIRLALLSGNYRAPLDFSRAMIAEARRRLDRWYRVAGDAAPDDAPPDSMLAALCDDLNTPKAIAALESLARPETAGAFRAGARFLGLLEQNADQWFRGGPTGDELSADEVERLIAERQAARGNRDFATADRIRDDLAAAGITLMDRPEGSTGWERG